MSSPRLRSADGRSDREGEEESSPLTGLQRVCLPSGPPSGASWPRVRSSTRGCCPHCSPASPPSRAPGSSSAVPRRAGRNEAAASRGDPRRLPPPSLRQGEVSSPIREPEDLLQRSTQPSLARITVASPTGMLHGTDARPCDPRRVSVGGGKDPQGAACYGAARHGPFDNVQRD